MTRRLISNWKQVLRKAWSVRLIILAGLLAGLEVIMPFFNHRFPPRTFALMMFTVTMAALIARFTAQKSIEDED